MTMSCRQRSRAGGRYATTLFSIALAGAPVACALTTPPPDTSTDAFSQAPWLWGGLRPGPYGVALETIATTDSTRPESRLGGAGPPRPIEILVWAPRRPGALTTPVTFADYVELSEGPMIGRARRSVEWRRGWLAGAVSRTPDSVVATTIDRVLDAPMLAVRDAVPLGERVPLILWSTRHATPAAQSVMSELLASHGYVVAWMRYAGRDSLSPPFDNVSPQRKAEIVDAHVADMQAAIRRLVMHPAVDSTRIGVAAWSYSGEPATLLVQRTPRVRALVSLSSSVFTWPYRPTLNVSASLDSVPLRADVMLLEETGATRGRVREAPVFLDRLPGKTFRVAFPELAHGNFNVLEGLIPELIGVTAVQPWSQSGPGARGGYQTVALSVLALLDKVLKGAPGDGSIGTMPDVRRKGVPTTGVSFMRHGPGRGVSVAMGTSFVDDSVEIASDAWRLVGNVVRPASNAPGPAVLMLNKANGDRRVYARLAGELARRGIGSLRIDLRGHGESTNLATFVPGLDNAAAGGEPRDVAAALRWLRAREFVDSTRIAVIGASYSGEAMAEVARGGHPARAYVALSPGSLSERTIDDIDGAGVPWSIIVSRNERFLRGVVATVRERSRTAVVTEVDGNAHATDILVAHPALNASIAEWLGTRLGR
jgi:dienelactone hydrolase